MRRVCSVLLVAGTLGGCAVVEADTALFSAADRADTVMADGLWAVLVEEPCPVPTGPDLARWPSCAWPVEITGDTIRVWNNEGRPVSSSWRLAGGQPLIAQFPPVDDQGFTFARVDVEGGPAQARSARVAIVVCPEEAPDMAGLRVIPGDGCRADAAEAVRTLARRQGAEGVRAVWIAPAAR